jgi:hypothetical protein
MVRRFALSIIEKKKSLKISEGGRNTCDLIRISED